MINPKNNTIDKWDTIAISYLPEKAQDALIPRMLGSEMEQQDVMAQLQTVTRMHDLGFLILDGNGKEGVFQVKHKKEEPFWVVSASLSRYIKVRQNSNSISENDILLAARRLVSHCLKKTCNDLTTLISINISDVICPENKILIDPSFLFSEKNLNTILHGCNNRRVPGLLFSIGDPSNKSKLEWFYCQSPRLNFKELNEKRKFTEKLESY